VPGSFSRRYVELKNPILDILCGEEKTPDWLVPDLFLQGAMVCIGGEPGTGKSYVSYMIGLAIASGCPALSGIVPEGPPKRVLYFDEENSEQDRDKYIRRCYQGLTIANGFEPDLANLYENFLPLSFALGGEAEWNDTAAAYIKEWKPHVCIFDTASPCFGIELENDNGVATVAIKKVRALMTLTVPKFTAIILRHAKMKTEEGGRRTMRGAKAWHGASDGVMFQVKAQGRPRKDGLNLTRLVPDKTRAWGLRQTIYITPRWTDPKHNGLALEGSYSATTEHKRAEKGDED
jgi:RecA-family ATPase